MIFLVNFDDGNFVIQIIKFVFAIGKGYAYKIFGSLAIMEFIERHIKPEARNYFLDGTFSVVPKPFKQLLTISIEYKNSVSIAGIGFY